MIGQLNRIYELEKLKSAAAAKRKGKVVAFTSGKGGTGKTFLSLNIAYTLAQKGLKILLIDFDPNLSNLNIMLNVKAEKTLCNFLLQKDLISNLITEYSQNLHFVFGDSGKADYPSITKGIIDNLFSQIKTLESNYDLIVIDSSAGASEELLYLLSNCDSKIIVTTPEPTAVMDAYVIIKMLKLRDASSNIGVIVNRVTDLSEGLTAFGNLNAASNHFLKTELNFAGTIAFDALVSKAIVQQELFIQSHKDHALTNAISKSADVIHKFIQMVNINQA